MTIVFDRPYEYVPRDSSALWPWLFQRLRLVDRYLVKKEGVVDYEVRQIDRLREPINDGHGVLLAPNHCRYADPLAMGWPGRLAPCNFYAMASWHLFNKSRFTTFAMSKCGAFSLNREGSDRKSLDTAIQVVSSAERPLILFAEGMTYRTNDVVRPLLDGLSFIARTAARRRAKQTSDGKVVIVPIGIKYLCVDDPTSWVRGQLDAMEHYLGWRRVVTPSDLAERTIQVSDAIFALNEHEFLGTAQAGSVDDRRQSLCETLLGRVEARLNIEPAFSIDVGNPISVSERARTIRAQIVTEYFGQSDAETKRRLQDDAHATDIAVDVMAYSNSYLQGSDVTDTRVVETIQRLQERLFGKAKRDVRLKCVMEIGESIEVPPVKSPRGEADPLLSETHAQISAMVARLAEEARCWS